MKISIDTLYILVSIIDGKPNVYPKVFTEDKKEEAEKLAKEYNMTITKGFIDNI